MVLVKQASQQQEENRDLASRLRASKATVAEQGEEIKYLIQTNNVRRQQRVCHSDGRVQSSHVYSQRPWMLQTQREAMERHQAVYESLESQRRSLLISLARGEVLKYVQQKPPFFCFPLSVAPALPPSRERACLLVCLFACLFAW